MYMQHKSGSLILSLSLLPSLRIFINHTQTTHLKTNPTEPKHKRRREAHQGEGLGDRESPKESKHLGNGVLLYPSTRRGRGFWVFWLKFSPENGRGGKTQAKRLSPCCFYCHLIQFIALILVVIFFFSYICIPVQFTALEQSVIAHRS